MLRRFRTFRNDHSAAAPIIGSLLFVGMVVLFSVMAFMFVRNTTPEEIHTTFPAMYVEEERADGTMDIWFLSGEPVAPDDAELTVIAGDTGTTYPLTEFTESMKDGQNWRVGDRLCIVGDRPGCVMEDATEVEVRVTVHDTLVYESHRILIPFNIMETGGIEALCGGPVTIHVVGTAITYGAGGPDIPVYVNFTENHGGTMVDAFNGHAVTGGETYLDPWVDAGSVTGVIGTADGYGFTATYASFDADPHVLVLADGDEVPAIEAFGDQDDVVSFLQPYINTDAGTVTLAHNEVILLYEFNPNVNSAAADFQDLVVLFRFPDGC